MELRVARGDVVFNDDTATYISASEALRWAKYHAQQADQQTEPGALSEPVDVRSQPLVTAGGLDGMPEPLFTEEEGWVLKELTGVG
jgi:hypothetical protein